MITRNLHLLFMLLIILSIIAGTLIASYISKNDNPNFITTPKPKIVYHYVNHA